MDRYEVISKTGDVTAPASGATATLYTSVATSVAGRGARYKSLILNMYSSHVSADMGVIFEESDNGGTDWRTTKRGYLPATTRKKFRFRPSAPEWRIRYTNSANTLTEFHWSLLGDPCEDIADPRPVTSALAPTYASSTNGFVSSTTSNATTTSIAYLWHASTVTKRYRGLEINVSWAGGAAGDPGLLKISRITAENGTPGGTSQTVTAMEADDVATTATFRTGAAAPTRGSTYDSTSLAFATPGSYTWNSSAIFDGKPFTMRPSVAEGVEVAITTGAAGPSTAASFCCSMKWIEED